MSALDFVGRALAVQANAAAAARDRSRALRALRYGAPAPVIADARRPIVSVAAATTIASADAIGKDDPRLTYAHGIVAQHGPAYPGYTANSTQWVSNADGTKSGTSTSLRFVTDAPFCEVQVLDSNGGSHLVVSVDGEILSRSPSLGFANTGGFFHARIDFGADTQTIKPSATIAAGGSGYAAGDEITVVGGTGAPAILVVTMVAAGAIASGYFKSYGAYTALPAAGAATTTSGGGTGATITLTSATALSGHTVRRMRRIELLGAGVKWVGVRVPLYSTVRPWPVAGVRLIAMLDSFSDTFHDYVGGAYPWRIGQRLGIEDVWVNGVGSTGFVAAITGRLAFRQRLPDIVAAAPANPATPLILFTQGSINDQAADLAALQAEVSAYYTQAFTKLPYAFLVQTGILRPPANSVPDVTSAAVKAGFLAAQAVHDPLGKRSGFIETRGAFNMMTASGKAGAIGGGGNSDYYIAGDGAHPTQDGHDWIGDVWAADLLGMIRGWGP